MQGHALIGVKDRLAADRTTASERWPAALAWKRRLSTLAVKLMSL
jgi:hypothetical protein